MAGFIYFFNTISDPSIYKAGETQQDSVAARMRSYLGPSKPRTIVVSRAVKDAKEAERLLLALLKQCTHFRFRPDYGDEWFEAITADVDERHQAAILLVDVVQRACEAHPRKVHYHTRVESPSDEEQGGEENDGMLPGYQTYFAVLDRYRSTTASPESLNDERALVREFDASDHCPIYPEYGRFTFEARVALAQRRYSKT